MRWSWGRWTARSQSSSWAVEVDLVVVLAARKRGQLMQVFGELRRPFDRWPKIDVTPIGLIMDHDHDGKSAIVALGLVKPHRLSSIHKKCLWLCAGRSRA